MLIISALEQTAAIIARTFPIVALTLLGVAILSFAGLMDRMGRLLSPLAGTLGLPRDCANAMAVSLGSSMSADTMTAMLWQENRLTWSQALVSAQANSIAPYILETATYMTPVIVPTLGFKPGLIYLLAFIFTAVLKLVLVLFMAKHLGPADQKQFDASEARLLPPGEGLRPKTLTDSLAQAGKTLWRVLRMMVPATFLVCLAVESGLLIHVQTLAKPALELIRLKEALLVPVAGYMASPLAGAATIGALYKGGTILAYDAALAALAGSLISLPIFWLRYALPRNIGLFGPGLGMANSVISLGLGMVSRLAFILALPLLI